MSDSVKRKCPECGKLALKRLIGTGSCVIFKGGGFYETDYRSDSYKKGADDAKKASEAKSDDKGDGKKKEKVSDKKSTKTETSSTKASEPKSSKKNPGDD
jgi:predicted nucleic acid-binding Zn ribbon protein